MNTILLCGNTNLEVIILKQKKQNEILKNQELINHYDYLKNAASSTDCTGLIPALPSSKEELESYQELYQYQTPLVKPKS